MKVGRTYFLNSVTCTQLMMWLREAIEPSGCVDISSSGTGTTEVRWESRASAKQLIIRARPQILELQLREAKNGVYLQITERCFRWYRILIVTSTLILLAAFWLGVLGFIGAHQPSTLIGSTALFVLSVVMACITWMLICTGAHDQLVEHLHGIASRNGRTVELMSPAAHTPLIAATRRYLYILLGAMLIPALIIAAFQINWQAAPFGAFPLLIIPLLIILIGAVLTARAVTREVGFELRFVVLIAGLSSNMFVLIFVACQIPLWAIGQFGPDEWAAVERVQVLLDDAPPAATVIETPSGPVPRAEIEGQLSMFRAVMWVFLSGVPLLLLFALVLGWLMTRKLDLALVNCERLQIQSGVSAVRAAISGRGFLRKFRWLLAPPWLLMASLCWLGVIGIQILAVGAVFELEFANGNTVVSSTGRAIEFAIGLDAGNAWVVMATRIGVCVLAVAVITGIAWSVGELIHRNRCLMQTLGTDGNERSCPKPDVLTDATIGLFDNSDVPPPVLVIRHEVVPNACAHEFGFIRPRRVIEITSGCVDILSTDELRAVIAHEWAHHALGHCRTHRLLHGLARWTFVGGVFVGAMEDSYQYERQADQFAIMQGGIAPEVLSRAIVKMRAVASTFRLMASLNRSGLNLREGVGQDVRESGGSLPKGLAGRTRSVFQCWKLLYTADTSISYWHPAINDRLDALGAYPGSHSNDQAN